MGKDAIEIRELEPGDETAAAEVAREAKAALNRTYLPSGAPPAPGPLTRLVAVLDGRVVGITAYTVKEDGLLFCNLGVLEAFRRRGVTRALVARLEAIAGCLGLTRLSCSTVEETGNAEIFGRLGFRVAAREPSARKAAGGGALHEVILEKDLAEGK